MYLVTYYASKEKDIIFNKWFKTLKESTDFANAMKMPELLIEIKYFDPNNPDLPKPPTLL
jgi:hypothetical protein